MMAALMALRLIGLLVLVGGLGGQTLDAFARFALLDAAGPVTPNPILTTATLDLTWAALGITSRPNGNTANLPTALIRGAYIAECVVAYSSCDV